MSSVKLQQAVDDVRKHGLTHEVGAAVTRGQGLNGYLAVCRVPICLHSIATFRG